MRFTRITGTAPKTDNIANLADRPANPPAELKALFDKCATDLAATEIPDILRQINDFLTVLESPDAVGWIGAKPLNDFDNYDANIFSKLQYLKDYIDKRQMEAGSGDMVQSLYDGDGDGVVNNSVLLAGHGIGDFVLASCKGVADGVVPLGSDGKVNASFLPPISASNIVGDSTFNGTAGRVISHSVGNTNYSVCWEPTQSTGGTVGEVWLTTAANSFTIYNTGSYVGAFRWMILRG